MRGLYRQVWNFATAAVLISMIRKIAPLALLLATACSAATAERPASSAPMPLAPAQTRITDAVAAEKLRTNAGVTLQWIDWNTRGTAHVREENGRWKLTAAQAQAAGSGRLFLDGDVTEIGADYFVFSGTIRITDTPDIGRKCESTRPNWRFAVTQGRPYWRMRTFEWCDGLTDYIDIYMRR